MTNTFEDTFEFDEQAEIRNALRENKCKKPDLSVYQNAIDINGKLLRKVGDKIIVEVSTTTGLCLYTQEFVIQYILENGNMGLFNVQDARQAGINYKKIDEFIKLKIPSIG